MSDPNGRGGTARQEHGRIAATPIQTGSPDYADKSTVTFHGVVYPWHLDHMGHMNVQHYVAMFDQSSWVLLSLIGLDASYFRETRCGCAALEQSIRYKSELHAGNVVEIRSAVIEIGAKTVRLLHHMCEAQTGIVAASTTILGIHLHRDTRKSAPIPEGIKARAQKLMPVTADAK